MDEAIIIVPAIFIGLPWIIFHYITKWKTAATLTTDDESLLEELYQLAKRLDERMDTVERLVASDNPDFKLATTSGRNWISRLALRKAVAAVEGIDNTEPSIILLDTHEDSTSSNEADWPKCDPSLPPDALLSSTMLTPDQLRELFKQ